MAAERGFSWSAAIIGALAALLLLVVTGAVIVLGGFYPISASSGHVPVVSSVLDKTMHSSVRQKASGLDPPRLSRSAILEGGSHFKGMCQQCHGGPGAKPEQFARFMNPDPPELSHAAREWSQAEIFWIAKHGIKMTGMPAFGQYSSDEELWKIAAFVDRLPNVSASEYASLPDAHASEDGGQGHSH